MVISLSPNITFAKDTAGLNIYVVDVHDPNDWEMWMAQAVSLREIGIQSTQEMCEVLIDKCCPSPKVTLKIRQLFIDGHGSEYGFSIGKDKITLETVDLYTPYFLSLMPLFRRDGVIKLGHCETGLNEELLSKVSTAFGGVAVKAYTGLQRVIRPNEFGKKWVTCVLKQCH